MKSSNIVYLPRWLKITFSVSLVVVCVAGLTLLIDSISFKHFEVQPGSALTFLQVMLPSFLAFAVVAYGKRQMSTKSIGRFVWRFFEVELADAIDVSRWEGSSRMAIREAGPYLRHITFRSPKGAEFAIKYRGKLTWVKIWFDMMEFTVLLRLPYPVECVEVERRNAYVRQSGQRLGYWVKRYLEKSWKVTFRPAQQKRSISKEIEYLEIWCSRKVTGDFLYDSLEQATVSDEIASLIRHFLAESETSGLPFEVDASWLPDEHRHIKNPYLGKQDFWRHFRKVAS
ncbi:hypothetical protein [Rhodovulum sp. BSW8]|uniref:hypothetical protein n=1 Tax=Rhodovulum sp. BSW8 TaxID=2259645 RepID=UPI001401DE4F|nr:hypothetical protein [Rhodovulum sp. BSW8]